MRHNLYKIKSNILSLTREGRDKGVIIILSILIVLSFFIYNFFSSRSSISPIPNEIILLDRNNYQVSYNEKTDSYKVRVKTEIRNTGTLIDTIEKDLKENLSEEEYTKVQWDVPGTLLEKEDQVTEYSSEEDLKGHLEEDIRRQKEVDEGTFLPDGH